jgi:AcrR family transcriptional regulator
MAERSSSRSAPGARETGLERRAASEEALLVAAAELVAEHGIEGATLEKIGQRAGLSRSLATYHFGSKDVLVEKLAQRAQDRISAAINEALSEAGLEAEDLTALERVRRTVSAQLGLFESPAPEDRAFVVLWAASFPGKSSIAGMKSADDRGLTGWRDLIQLGREDGSIRADVDPLATATWLMGLTRGLAAVLATHPVEVAHGEVRRNCDLLITAALDPSRRGSSE